MLQEREKKLATEVFKELKNPVKLVDFTQELGCQFCRETRQLLEEVARLSDKVSLEICDFQLDKQKAEVHRVDKIPATVIEGDKNDRIRYYGVPRTVVDEDFSGGGRFRKKNSYPKSQQKQKRRIIVIDEQRDDPKLSSIRSTK